MNLKLEKFRLKCEQQKIPIIRSKTQKLLVDEIKKIKPKKILEIGMAVGYSSCVFGLNFNCLITCVELDEKNIQIAKKNHKFFNLSDKIQIILSDAKVFQSQEKFDVIFIDAAKSWYLEYFNKFKNNLNSNGIMIFDNVNYHGLLNQNERKHRTIVNKMNKFHEYINNQKEFKYKWYNIDDGVLILAKNENNL